MSVYLSLHVHLRVRGLSRECKKKNDLTFKLAPCRSDDVMPAHLTQDAATLSQRVASALRLTRAFSDCLVGFTRIDRSCVREDQFAADVTIVSMAFGRALQVIHYACEHAQVIP